MDQDVLLKKNLFGGYNRKQVIDYISQLQESCNDRKTRGEIEDLRLRIAELRDTVSEKDREIASLTHKIEEINKSTVPLDGSEPPVDTFDVLKRSAEQFEQAKVAADEITAKISEGIKSKDKKLSALFSQLASINADLSKFEETFAGLSTRIGGVNFAPVTEEDVDPSNIRRPALEEVIDALAEEEAKREAEELARIQEEEQKREEMKAEFEQKLREEAEAKAKIEEELRRKEASEARIKAEFEQKLSEEAAAKEDEKRLREEAEEKQRLIEEKEAEARAEEERQLREEAEAQAKAEEEQRLLEEKETEAEAEEEAQPAEEAETQTDAEEEQHTDSKAETEEKAPVSEADKFDSLFAKLSAMTKEIDKRHGSSSDGSKKAARVPEQKAESVSSSEDIPEKEKKSEIINTGKEVPVKEEIPEIPAAEEKTVEEPSAAEEIITEKPAPEIKVEEKVSENIPVVSIAEPAEEKKAKNGNTRIEYEADVEDDDLWVFDEKTFDSLFDEVKEVIDSSEPQSLIESSIQNPYDSGFTYEEEDYFSSEETSEKPAEPSEKEIIIESVEAPKAKETAVKEEKEEYITQTEAIAFEEQEIKRLREEKEKLEKALSEKRKLSAEQQTEKAETAKPEIKPETKPEVKVEAKPETKPDDGTSGDDGDNGSNGSSGSGGDSGNAEGELYFTLEF